MCPKGDDPFTYFTDYRAIIVALDPIAAPFTGSFKLTYYGSPVSIPSSGWTDELCQEAFQALPAFKTVRCRLSFKTTRYGGFTMQIEFIEFAPIPYQNNVYYHEGNPPLSAFKCDTAEIVTTGGISCIITDVTFNSLPGILFYWFSFHCCSSRIFHFSCASGAQLFHFLFLQNTCIVPIVVPVIPRRACVIAMVTSSPPTAAHSPTAFAPWKPSRWATS